MYVSWHLHDAQRGPCYVAGCAALARSERRANGHMERTDVAREATHTNPGSGLDAHFIRLNASQVAWLCYEVEMEGISLLASRPKPGANGEGMEANGVFAGDKRPVPGDQADDEDDWRSGLSNPS